MNFVAWTCYTEASSNVNQGRNGQLNSLHQAVATALALDEPKTQYAVKVGDLQWVRIPAGPSVARPKATRAAQGGNEFVEVLCVKVTEPCWPIAQGIAGSAEPYRGNARHLCQIARFWLPRDRERPIVRSAPRSPRHRRVASRNRFCPAPQRGPKSPPPQVQR